MHNVANASKRDGNHCPVREGSDASQSVGVLRNQLREEFPGWSVIYTTDTGRWWALRTADQARRDDPDAPLVTAVEADTAEQLGGELRKLVS